MPVDRKGSDSAILITVIEAADRIHGTDDPAGTPASATWAWSTAASFISSNLSGPTITQANSFSAGELVGISGGSWVLADANNSIIALGMVGAATGSDFVLWTTPGYYTLSTHGWTAGRNWLSETAGAPTTTEPSAGSISQEVLWAIDADTFILFLHEADE